MGKTGAKVQRDRGAKQKAMKKLKRTTDNQDKPQLQNSVNLVNPVKKLFAFLLVPSRFETIGNHR